METTRPLGRGGIEVSALGFGCWAIGGEWQAADGQPLGRGRVDDEESVRAVRRALDLGVTFFDTADTYGAGHSERVLGRALGKRRADAVVATKWGNVFDEDARTLTGSDDSPAYLRRALTASLRRLGTDYVDLYQFHLSDAAPEQAVLLREACEELVREGLIRAYAWSTDDPARACVFAEGPHCAAVQHALNVLQDAPEMLRLCEEAGLASINRSPLAMGLLTGKRRDGQALEAGASAAGPRNGCGDSVTPAPTRSGSPVSTPSGRSSPARAARSPRAPWPGCGHAARARFRSPVSGRSPRRRRTRGLLRRGP
ncbi:Aldo/keto reductase family protein [Streptomyces sp. Ag82_O1-12]|nr:Aldo/keto reductase family protein [Streptomyces sp. Ag82_O1-12]SOD44908.1 Aldo/keto reductase family protein [Streptomyces sp. Ag82_G6-1]